MKKKALITGISGQDGTYLAELLISKGYIVHGVIRPTMAPYLRWVPQPVVLHFADVTDSESISYIMNAAQPDEIYNLAAQSHVGLSFQMPAYTMGATGGGCLNVLEAMRQFAPRARFYQASSSEMFGNQSTPQSESTPFAPVSPYACAKLFAHHTAVSYRQAYNLHVSCGILFNHESPRRGASFVTRKIVSSLARIKAGLQDKLVLGNVAARRDWGYAPEYVQAMWLMLQHEHPGDYVIGTGKTSSVAEFLNVALDMADLPASVVETAESYKRPTEIHELRADPEKAKRVLGWEAHTDMKELARIMITAEMEAVGL